MYMNGAILQQVNNTLIIETVQVAVIFHFLFKEKTLIRKHTFTDY